MPIQSRTKTRFRTHSMYLVSGSFAALTMGNPTLVAAMVQDEAAMTQDEAEVVTTPPAAMSDEQQAMFDSWPADQQAAFMGWPEETKIYYWSLAPERQDLFWRHTDDNKISLTAMGEEDRASAWQMIEARAAAVEGGEAEAPPPPPAPEASPEMESPAKAEMPSEPER